MKSVTIIHNIIIIYIMTVSYQLSLIHYPHNYDHHTLQRPINTVYLNLGYRTCTGGGGGGGGGGG